MAAEARQTRSALQDQGERMAAAVKLGQVIAVELTFESEVFMLGVVTREKYTIERQYLSEYMGTLKPGDHVVEVRKFEPVQSGSSRFTLTSDLFPDFIEDIRDVVAESEFVHEGGPQRSERQSASFSSSAAALADTHRFLVGSSLLELRDCVNSECDFCLLSWFRRVEVLEAGPGRPARTARIVVPGSICPAELAVLLQPHKRSSWPAWVPVQ